VASETQLEASECLGHPESGEGQPHPESAESSQPLQPIDLSKDSAEFRTTPINSLISIFILCIDQSERTANRVRGGGRLDSMGSLRTSTPSTGRLRQKFGGKTIRRRYRSRLRPGH
jgi:hypothetical protein